MGYLKKRCKTYGCRNLHSNPSGYCDECESKYKATHSREYDKKRPSYRERGYDSKWDKFSKDYLALHPTCAICGAPATCVDHKRVPADVMMDLYGSFSYDPEEYQALCSSCNARKGATTDKKIRKEYFDTLKDIREHEISEAGGGFKKFNPLQFRVGSDSPTHGGSDG